jgi:hypothetical protein
MCRYVKVLTAVWLIAFAATLITTVPRAGSPWWGYVQVESSRLIALDSPWIHESAWSVIL